MHHSLQGSKATPYDEACHIPFLMQGPGVHHGSGRNNSFFSSVDDAIQLLRNNIKDTYEEAYIQNLGWYTVEQEADDFWNDINDIVYIEDVDDETEHILSNDEINRFNIHSFG